MDKSEIDKITKEFENFVRLNRERTYKLNLVLLKLYEGRELKETVETIEIEMSLLNEINRLWQNMYDMINAILSIGIKLEDLEPISQGLDEMTKEAERSDDEWRKIYG